MGEIMVRGSETSSVERIERFQALSAGQYWRSREAIPEEGIEAQTVLLVQSIRLVDEVPHTIILRPHPRHIGGEYEYTVERDDGRAETRWARYDEHRFLLQDFLRQFEYEPDAQKVRAAEAADVQQRVRELQQELVEAPQDPLKLAHIIEEGLEEDAKEAARKAEERRYYHSSEETEPQESTALPTVAAAPRAEVVQLARGTVSQALASGITPELIEELKTAASREHQIATIKARWITGKTQEIAETIQALTPFYEEQAAAALAQTEDVRAYVDALLSGIASLDLYVGKGVQVETLRKGASAAAETPLTLVQRKLLMDEELAVWADVDERFDFSSEERFFEALVKHDGLLRQIFPTERCVLVMATTRRRIDYGDPWVNAAKDERNKAVFLLARDGENLYRIFSPVESHLGAACLFPSSNEQDAIFRGLDGRHIKFEDVAYTDKLSVHEKFALHYKRFLLLLCGLDHRLKLFGEFYPGPATFDFVSLEFQERYMRFLFDGGDRSLEAQIPPLREWIEEKNRYLRSGSRVLCNWNSLMTAETAPGACRPNNDRHGRGFSRHYHPAKRYGIATVYKDGEELCVEVEVSGQKARSYDTRTFNCRVSLTRAHRFRLGYDSETLPFLVLDAVDPQELRPYIHRRDMRVDHLFYIRFFKTAIKYLEQEAAGEVSARAALKAALQDGRVATGAEADELISRSVRAWRAANNGAPLPPPSTGAPSRNWKSLLDQLYQLAGAGSARAEIFAQYAQSQGLEPLRLVLSGTAKFCLYAAPSAAQRDDRIEPHAFVHRLTLERTRSGTVREHNRRWVSLPERSASETTVQEWPAAADWAKVESFFDSFAEKQAVLESIEGAAARLKMLAGPVAPEQWEVLFRAWQRVREKLLAGRFVRNPEFAIVFGLIRRPDSLRYLAIGSHLAHAILHRIAPDEAARLRLRAEFIRAYKVKPSAGRQFDEAVRAEQPLRLYSLPRQFRKGADEGFFAQELGVESRECGESKRSDPRLNTWWQAYVRAQEEKAQISLSADLGTDICGVDFDALLNVSLPPDYEALNIAEYRLHAKNGTTPQWGHWFDVLPEGTPEPAVPEGHGYRRSGRTATTRARARAFIEEQAIAEGGRLVRDQDLLDAPPTPSVVLERWYLME